MNFFIWASYDQTSHLVLAIFQLRLPTPLEATRCCSGREKIHELSIGRCIVHYG